MSRAVEPPAHMKLAVVVSHPTQYYAAYYRALARDPAIELKVFFCTRIALDEVMDRDMGVKLSWKTDLLGGYESQFLPEAGTSSFYTPRSFANE